MSARLDGLIGRTVSFKVKDLLVLREDVPPFKVERYVVMNGKKVGLCNAKGEIVKVMPIHMAEILSAVGEVLWCFSDMEGVIYYAAIEKEEERE